MPANAYAASAHVSTALTSRAAASPWPLPSSHPYRALIDPYRALFPPFHIPPAFPYAFFASSSPHKIPRHVSSSCRRSVEPGSFNRKLWKPRQQPARSADRRGGAIDTLAMHLLDEQDWENFGDIQNVRDIRESLAGAKQGTTTKTGPEDPARDLQVPEMTNKVNECQFDQIAKKRNYKRSLLKCVDAMAQRKVLPCPPSTILGACD